jgi:hypothetical protein
MANQTKDIKYINKNFDTFKADLIEYAKSYYPTTYTDFNQASPGSMFIEMASYVGDVLSYYLDNQIQETFAQYAKQANNLYPLAYMLGYRPKVISTALVDLDVYQQIPYVSSGGFNQPDFSYALVVNEGMQVKSNINGEVSFYAPERIDFRVSSSLNPTDVSVYTLDRSGNPTSYLLKKTTQAISGQVKTVSFDFGSGERFASATINDSNIISIISAVDSDGNNWYEVPYLAQDYILSGSVNNSLNDNNLVPYMMQKQYVNRRFTTRFQSNESLVIEFGSGINTVADTAIIPNPNTVSVGLTPGGLSQMGTAFDPTNFVTTQTYGLAPKTTITFSYLVGGGASANVLSNELTQISSVSAAATNPGYEGTLAVNNPSPASGGGDGDTIQEVRMNAMSEFQTQYRAVTEQDYLARTLSMPVKFGKISKAYLTKDDITFANYNANDPADRDPILISMYILGLDFNGNLATPSANLMKNLSTYLQGYRMLTDSINIKPAYIINIGVNYDIVLRPNYNSQDVLTRTLTAVKGFFDTGNWQINQPIILSSLYSLIDSVEGVQTVKNIEVTNLSGEANGYSKYSYDIKAGTLNNVIYPSLDPSIFEVKYPDEDIKGRVVTL